MKWLLTLSEREIMYLGIGYSIGVILALSLRWIVESFR